MAVPVFATISWSEENIKGKKEEEMFRSGFGFLTTGDVGVKHHPRNSGRNNPKSQKNMQQGANATLVLQTMLANAASLLGWLVQRSRGSLLPTSGTV